ncbi:hypothetical protein E1212_02975 [Jiangella ureilytica]|uniref:Uncharacterized protein n=1 Tax=Jiangella ureilytica TaxID=2530374 RepID=A0A4R4RW78_9ACTN|nr:hypothetical protein [Jiangella ureilytica]TDC54417.1 hypothetical protein E1212_02975 [Jiangella ureilytica]
MPTKTDLPPAAISDPFVPDWAGLAALAPSALSAAAGAIVAAPLPAVNTTLVSPAGFDPFDDDGPGSPPRRLTHLRTQPSGELRIDDGRTRLVELDRPAVVSAAQLAALRPYAGVRVPFGAGAGPVELAGLLRQLLVGGVPVLAPDLPLVVRRLLGTELGGLVAGLTKATLADPDRRERWSVAARRAALRSATSAAGVASSPPSVTAVVPPGDRALARDLRRQTWPALTVRVASGAVERRRALESCETELVTLPASGLSYAAEHIEDLVLGRGYGQRPLSGAVVRRTYLPALDVTVRAAGSGAGERPATVLTAATVLGSPADLLRLGVDSLEDASATVDVGDDGYAIHDLGVQRVVRDAAGVEAALRAGGRQLVGTGRVDPGYASYFARTA